MKNFQPVRIPNRISKLIPDDITLRPPQLDIPWDEAYRQRIPDDFLEIFETAFESLHTNSLDVRVAISLAIVDELLRTTHMGNNERLHIGTQVIAREVNKHPLSADADRLWAFTHENFWQESVRGDIDPHAYWETLRIQLLPAFVTEPGKKLAARMLGARRDELWLYDKKIQGRI